MDTKKVCTHENQMEFDRAENGMQVFACTQCGEEIVEHEDSQP